MPESMGEGQRYFFVKMPMAFTNLVPDQTKAKKIVLVEPRDSA